MAKNDTPDTTPTVNTPDDGALQEQRQLVASGERGEYIDLPDSVKTDDANNLSADTVAQLEVLPGQQIQGKD